MIADVFYFDNNKWNGLEGLRKPPGEYQLLLVFAEKNQLSNPAGLPTLRQLFTEASIVCGSSAGEIYFGTSRENITLCIAISLNYTTLSFSLNNIGDFENSYALGIKAARDLSKENLQYVFILSDGSLINGSELITGLVEVLGNEVTISGGMAGDNTRFESTLVGLNNDLREGNLVLVGFYGTRLKVSFGNRGGFISFGPERIVTRSEKNILYEIDGLNALDLYKRYLGKYATELPGSALFFPAGIQNPNGGDPLVRTILSVDEENQSMVFAGNIPVGSKIRLMRAPLDNLIAMAGTASADAVDMINRLPELALVMNCVGRKIVLAERANEETEAIAKAFPEHTAIAGMYTYGEFSPSRFKNSDSCLHNQTVVITLFHED